MVVNDPEVVKEIAELYPRYERALVENDVTALQEMFWRSGVRDALWGERESVRHR